MSRVKIVWLSGLGALIFCGATSRVRAELPVPTAETSTVHGAQTVDGVVLAADVGHPALRVGAYFGKGGKVDFGVLAAVPTLGNLDLNGYFQNVGLDLRVPIRFRLIESSKITGSLRLAPLFHVGRFHSSCSNLRRGFCDTTLGMGTTVGFLLDFPLPKIFKLIVGIDTRWGFWHIAQDVNRFQGSVLSVVGLEAFWNQWFFTLTNHIGASYWSGNHFLSRHTAEPVFRSLVGAGYQF